MKKDPHGTFAKAYLYILGNGEALLGRLSFQNHKITSIVIRIPVAPSGVSLFCCLASNIIIILNFYTEKQKDGSCKVPR